MRSCDFTKVLDAHLVTSDEMTFQKDDDKIVINLIKDVAIGNQIVSAKVTIFLTPHGRIP